jgi:hypothetical protein
MNAAQKLAECEAAIEKLRAAIKRAREKWRGEEIRLNGLCHERDRLRLVALIGKPNAVRLSIRWHPSERLAKHNDARGTIVSVGRKNCVVDFDGERWQLPAFEVAPADDEQGMQIKF